MPIDTLALAKALHGRGFTAEQAESLADALRQTLMDAVAGKDDILHVRGDLLRIATRDDISEVRSSIDGLRVASKADVVALRADIETLRAATKAEIDLMRDATRAEIRALREETATNLTRGKYQMAGAILVAIILAIVLAKLAF